MSFTFKQFAVAQDRCAMKVGTDGVLLGAWAAGGRRILDIGTGTGLIAMMMAQRFGEARITAVDIDADAAQQAAENIGASPFAARIGVLHTPIQAYDTAEPFDAIVSNPPFFTASLKNPDAARATARHDDALPFAQLMAAVKRLMASNGEFSAIVPADAVARFDAQAYMAGLSPSRRCMVRTTPRKQPKRCLVAYRHADTPHTLDTDNVCLQVADGTRSQWYADLTADFYIK